ncbi:MAG TPA: sucrase ferredoxin [Pyrinomonadaceae bacterium]|jgi:hypothetical protein
MSQDYFFCSEQSRLLGEKSFGTASTGDVWLLLEYPFWWGSRALQDSHLPPRVKRYLNNFTRTVPRSRVLFIKQDRARTSSERTVFLVRAREHNPSILQFKIGSYEQLIELDPAKLAKVEARGRGLTFDGPLYLVCTHGKRDKCCAKFGYPLYKSLKQMHASVWQSSHVGGDRFAANLVCFPHGLFYAHVTEASSRAILEEYGRRRLVLEKYRGRACYSYPVQAAEFFIRSESGVAELDGLRRVGCERLDENSWRVKFVAPAAGMIHEAKVVRTVSDFETYNTCHATERKPVTQYVLGDYSATEEQTAPTA